VALERIVADKRAAVAARKRSIEASPSDRSLEQALAAPRTGFILECKKASPSKGLLREHYDPAAIAQSYAPFADAISVLTDEPYFRGSFEHLRAVRESVSLPVLCKDFVVDPFQLHEARAAGADAVLLMCSVLDQTELVHCLDVARSLALDCLVEVHDEEELSRALDAGARIVGINNRNLRTLEVDLSVSRRLAPLVPSDRLVVCESGIGDHRDVVSLRDEVDAFLVGTSLMKAPELDAAVRELVFGRVKICGLTQPSHARAARALGATHGGLMLWPSSKRALDVDAAIRVRDAADLSWVGVFVDQPVEEVARAAQELALDAVQLHGNEDRAYVARLRALAECAVWKAQRVSGGAVLARAGDFDADRLLLDAHVPGVAGGSGQRFDWRLLEGYPSRSEIILSGGIAPDNAAAADALGSWALDLSSGVERAPGDKDEGAMAELFTALRGRAQG
jgi:indole-3-glycerol phosphate synthase/phosphoribosylanthranilate isomerase